jgi:very-short-patch-repair endonuclease/endonuclease YncB( thermonuclease family)
VASSKLLSNNPKDPALNWNAPTYQGFQSTRTEYAENSLFSNPAIKVASVIGLGWAARSFHQRQLEQSPTYLDKLNRYTNIFEDRSPSKIFRTFGLSDRLGAYNAGRNGPLTFTRDQLFHESGGFTATGEHFQRLFGDRVDFKAIQSSKSHEGLKFNRTSASSRYLTLEGHPDIEVQFGTAKGSLAGTASRIRRQLRPNLSGHWSNNGSLYNRIKESAASFKHAQVPSTHPGSWGETTSEFLPTSVWFDANKVTNRTDRFVNRARNIGPKIELETLNQLERGQKLLAETLRLGVNNGSYNRAFTIPGFAREGERGLVNALMSKRVVPIALGLTAAAYGDYLTGHVVSNTAVNTVLKANVIRAELTDRIPFARKTTDTYEDVVPGAQYAPLALPLGGAFAGGLYHYSKVIRNKFDIKHGETLEEARNASARLLPNLKAFKNIKNLEGLKTGLKTAWSEVGAPGKGLLLGLAAMVPFIPGMIGSRKTARELRDIYSGDENVPIRSGRWWSLGSSSFGGGRISSWRPHWSLLFKSRSRTKSLWGSEKNAWANNPILHPIKYLRNPYALEEQNYRDRPYPITSPAFSNVPLVGPLLAATIGKLIKPVKRMHEDEFDDTDYRIYSSRLAPKGPLVESPFEKDILQDLSRRGYKAETQVKIGKSRVDFVLRNDHGKDLVIEADGDTYHTKWNAKADADRQKKIEDAGYDVLRVRSGTFFKNEGDAMNQVFGELNRRGIQPTGNIDGDAKSGLVGLAPSKPKEEFGIIDAIKQEAYAFSEFIGLPGYVGRVLLGKVTDNPNKKPDVYLQGSRQIDSLSKQYYESNLGEGLGPQVGEGGSIGYTEPVRRFIQRDTAGVQANDIKNTMPSWLPGEDYLIDFKVGDPFGKLDQGYARLPGKGYEALHPELEGVNPENYPDLTKLGILADVAPYSREFNQVKDRLGKSIGDDTELRIRYEKILQQAQEAKDSILQTDKRRFTGKVDNITGTVKAISSKGVELNEFPGRTLKYSSLGMSAADLSAVVLGQKNNLTRSEVATEVNQRQRAANAYLSDRLKPGTRINATIPFGAIDDSEHISAVITADGENINKELIDRGYAQYNKKYGGAEAKELFSTASKVLGSVAERLSFDLPNFLPTPYHTKLWQERTAYDQYVSQEVVGTRMRRWDRPFDDFASPYLRGALNKATGIKVMSEATLQRRDLNTLADQLKYLRALHNIAEDTGDEYTRDTRRTNIGTNLLASPIFVASTIPDRDKRYFQQFLGETDPDKRIEILNVVSPEMAKTLQAQWGAADARVAKASGTDPGLVQSQGRLITEDNLDDFKKAKTKLGYGDYLRSKEIAGFFTRTGFTLPEEPDSQIFNNNLDYEDVKLKIIKNEGYDAHDFNIFDDRAAMLWRKPYVDGAVSALTSGDASQSGEQIRRSVEQLMIQANNKNSTAKVVTQSSRVDRNNVKINIDVDQQEKLMKDIRRNPDDYKE